MLIKFETKSARVKALTFHPKRTWLLASLHNGVIQLWDYSEKTIMDKFDEHKGPVRGLDFHINQPLFVSGGDDSKIKVWNYKSRRCLFTLDAHEDYIRSTFFHREEPWIVSCSDDQSIRIWNWINRTKINLLTGHTHYVMCAQFHPANDLILSASIDQTLRLWDISSLRKKSTSSNNKDDISLPEILSKTDYTVESKDAHNSEINWCAFHPDPKKQLCLSTGDDTYIKLWKIDQRRILREVDTLRGHYNHVNCAIFHPKKDLILSASDDRSIRVWDVEKRSALCTHRKEVDRFWAIAAHPNENLFAAGHDNGLILFKLERERPVYCVIKQYILFIKNNQLHHYNMDTNETRSMLTLKNKTELTHHYHKLHCYSYVEGQANQVLISTRSVNINNSIHDLYKIPPNYRHNQHQMNTGVDTVRSQGLTAIFVGRNRCAILDKSKRVTFKFGDSEKKPDNVIDANEIYDAGPGRLFVKSKVDDVDQVSLWDLEKFEMIHTVKFDAKFVVMSKNKKFVACVGANRIVICDGELNVLTAIDEQRKIKSAVWDESGVLFYNTPVHIKYALTDGDRTTVRSVEQVLYLIAIKENILFYMNRNGDVKCMNIYPAEFKFKQAVIKNNKAAIVAALKELKTPTRAEISFLVKKGHPGIALKYVKDHKTRFPLAIQAYQIDMALESAIQINHKRCWEELAEAALDVGHVLAAERAFIKLKKPYRLALLYMACEQRDKMLEARQMAKEIGDTSSEFIISILLKDFEGCARIIHRYYPNVAYICAVNHGLYDLAKEYREELTEVQIKNAPPLDNALNANQWMEETIPDIGNKPFENFPLASEFKESFESIFEDAIQDEMESANEELEDEEPEDELEDEWGEDDYVEEIARVVAPNVVGSDDSNTNEEPANEITQIRANMPRWSVEDVVQFIESHEDIAKYASAFAEDEVDGAALLLMIDGNLTQMLAPMFKRGPATKIEAALSKYSSSYK